MNDEQTMYEMSEREAEQYDQHFRDLRTKLASALPTIGPMLNLMSDETLDLLFADLCMAINEMDPEQAQARLDEIVETRGVCPDCGEALASQHTAH